MTISTSLSQFHGLPVATVETGTPFPPVPGPVAWRYAVEGDGEDADHDGLLRSWLAGLPHPGSVTALVVGPWGDVYEAPLPLRPLIEAKPRLTGLRALFLGEMTFEECEISWITQTDITPVLRAFHDQLEVLYVRGGQHLVLQPGGSTVLRELVIETGGLDGSVVDAIARSRLPALQRLDLWLGTEEYGATTTDHELTPLLSGAATPNLQHLALKNSDRPLENIALLAGSPLLPRLMSLDLSMSTTGDECLPLLTSGAFAHLRGLDLHYHYLSDPAMDHLRQALPHTVLNLSEQEEPDSTEPEDSGRYVAVGE